MKIAEQLYVYLWDNPQENNCNTVFIDGKVPLLIDPGVRHRTSELFGKMRADGVDPLRTRVVICTHAHPDHFEGTSAFKEPSVRVALTQREEQYIEETGRAAYGQKGMKLPEYRVDFYLKDGELTLGKHEFEIILTPGHTPGGLALYWPRYKVLISGDIVFSESVGRHDFPGGDSKALGQSVDKLSEVAVELLVPGHGAAIQGRDEVRQNFEFVKRMFFR